MKHIIGAIIFGIIGSSWSPACADNDLKACIKYQHSDYTWSHEYAVFNGSQKQKGKSETGA